MLATTAVLLAVSGCATPTEVLVTVDTDVPASLPLALSVRASRGRLASAMPAERRWHRAWDGGTSVDGGLRLPASFAVVPGGGPDDGPVFLEVEADAGGVLLRRRVSFRFVAHQLQTLRVFLSTRCLAPTSGCSSTVSCTVLQRCEEQGLTCDETGTCVNVPTSLDRDSSLDVAPPPPCGRYGEPCCYVGEACGAPLSCVSNRCQRCIDPGELCCNGATLQSNGTQCRLSTSATPGACVEGECLVLEAPMDVMAEPTSGSSVTVRWSAVPSSSVSYLVELSTDMAFTAPVAARGIMGTSHVATGLNAGRRYYARVRAVAADGRTSPWSSIASALTPVAAPATPSVDTTIPGGIRAANGCCWVDPPNPPTGNYYYAQGHASASCPAGTSAEYRFQAQYTSPTTLYGWTPWGGADAFMVRPLPGYGVRFHAQARCVGPDATSGASGAASDCMMRDGGGC